MEREGKLRNWNHENWITSSDWTGSRISHCTLKVHSDMQIPAKTSLKTAGRTGLKMESHRRFA